MVEQALQLEQDITVSEPGRTAVDLLAEATALSRHKVKLAMTKGAVWLSHGGAKPHRLRRATKVPGQGDQLSIHYDEHVLNQQPEAAMLIADEGDYSVWMKPFGMFSQGSKWGDHCTIYRWAEQHLQPQRSAVLVHRLDRAATGLILLAHNKRAAKGLSNLFLRREIDKRYQVVVHGQFPESVWPHNIETELDGKPAKSVVKFLAYDATSGRSLLEVRIETGRKHQIRRHLKSIDFNVVGDRQYGQVGDSEDLQLAAVLLAFRCPLTDQEREYQIPLEYQPPFPGAE